MLQPFTPIFGSTVSLNSTDTTGNVALSSAKGTHILVVNTGGSVAYVDFGISTVAAVVADLPILPQSAFIICIPAGATHMAAICDSGATTTVKATLGYGQ